MKINIPTVAVVPLALSREASAKPVEIKELVARQTMPGQTVLCSVQHQCSTVTLLTPGNSLCADFSGELSFLNDNLASVSMFDMGFIAFSDFGCNGTNLGNRVFGGVSTFNMANFDGRNVEGLGWSIDPSQSFHFQDQTFYNETGLTWVGICGFILTNNLGRESTWAPNKPFVENRFLIKGSWGGVPSTPSVAVPPSLEARLHVISLHALISGVHDHEISRRLISQTSSMLSTEQHRKTTFDVHWGKPFIAEIVEGCAFCRILAGPRGELFPLCSGCRTVRFCSREHQLEYWPEHKEFCKHQTKMNKQRDRVLKEEQTQDGLLTHAERKSILDDWIEVHRHGIEEALASAIYTSDPPFNFKTQLAQFGLEYDAESGGNPATAFILRSLKLVTEPEDGPLSVFRGWVRHAEDEEKNNPGYAGHLLCDFDYGDKVAPSLTAMPIFKKNLRSLSVAGHLNWFLPLHYTIKQGVVFRLVGPSGTRWTPGIIERQDSKHWVWRRKTVQELKEAGIELMTPETLFEFEDVRI